MKSKIVIVKICVAFAACLNFFYAGAQSPVINAVTVNNSNISRLQKFELTISLTAGYANAYDYDDIAVQCVFTTPSHKRDTVDAFYMQHYTLNSNGTLSAAADGSFRVRYTPVEAGIYSYVVSCKNTAGYTAKPAATFTVNASSGNGFVRKNKTAYLNFDNGLQYVPIGENMCWNSGNIYNSYTKWLTSLTENGGNFIRVWMPDWSFGFEWKKGNNGFEGLKKYKQDVAFYLDWLFEFCRQKHVYIMLCLNHHGQVSTGVNPEWANNPYNRANGGPCANTWDFFTDSLAKATIKNRLRYINARYGFSQNLMSWELFNEVEWTDNFSQHKTDITNWHTEMAAYLKAKDVNKHLVTTSYAHDNNDSATWMIPNIDFTQTHYYVNSPAIESVMAAGTANYLHQFNKPTLNGEFGLGPGGDVLTKDDPKGVHIHNAIWGSIFSGAMGSAMTWWWDNYIEPQNLYKYYKPLAAFVNPLKLKDDNYTKADAFISGGGSSDLAISPGASFGKSPAASFVINAAGNMAPDASRLSTYLFGKSSNIENRNPPGFNVHYKVAGQFKVVTAKGAQGKNPKIAVYVDGVVKLEQNAESNATYTVEITEGDHSIKVDNTGADWLNISSYIFTNTGSAVNGYVLKSATGNKAAGWLLNNKYNWKYILDNSGALPPVVTGAIVNVPGMRKGNYTIQFYSCLTGEVTSSFKILVKNNMLVIKLPPVTWDMAFTAVKTN